MANRVNSYNRFGVMDYACTGAVAGASLGAVSAVVLKLVADMSSSENCRPYDQNIRSCYLGLRLAQFSVIPIMSLMGAIAGAAVWVTHQVAQEVFRG